jgi:DNA helicase-2/ATP-dependent DNA helicase PcrA
VDRIVGTAEDLEAAGSLEAAARKVLPDLTTKARTGLTAFLKAIEGSRELLVPDAAPQFEDEQTGPAPARPTKEKKPKRSNKREGLKAGEGLSACVMKLVEDSGIAGYHLSHDDINGNQRIGNLQELINAASLYAASREGLLLFLEHIELDRSIENETESEDDRGTVTLITLHNTKGLEFRRVIMTGIEQGVFPRDDKQGDDLEEERRLFYVGATRAMDELYLCTCALRRMFGRTMPMSPSLFLSEADQSELRVIGKSPFGDQSPFGNQSPWGDGAYRDPGGSFTGGAQSASQSGGASPRQGSSGSLEPSRSRASSDGRWKQGDRIFHDDHGYGAVTEIRESDDGPVITVRFETGRETHFLSLHQSSRFLKLGNDV